MRVIFTHDVAHNAGAFHIGFCLVKPVLMHGVKDAAMHRFQPVAHIRNGAGDDNRHRIIEVGALHLLFDCYRRHTFLGDRRRTIIFVFRDVSLIGHSALDSASLKYLIKPSTLLICIQFRCAN